MLRVVDHGQVRELRLDRPPVNALTRELFEALSEAITAAATGERSALVLSGSPGCFSAGLDVPHLLALEREEVLATFRALFSTLTTLGRSELPVAAAIGGHAPAGGAVLALFCDYRVMAEGEFQVGLNEVRVGLPVPPIIYTALTRLVGVHAAERLCVEGRLVDPGEALRLGLVDELVPPDAVLERALRWCRDVAALPQGAMRRTRALARAELMRLLEAPESLLTAELAEAWFEPEAQATLRALAERLGKD